MVSLLDIAPASIEVDTPSGKLEVHGLTPSSIAAILRRFPAFGKLLTEGLPELPNGADIEGEGQSSAAALAFATSDAGATVVELMPPIIAAGCGFLGNEKAENNAAYLPAPVQRALFNAIMQLTMTTGTPANPLAGSDASNGEAAGSGKAPATS